MLMLWNNKKLLHSVFEKKLPGQAAKQELLVFLCRTNIDTGAHHQSFSDHVDNEGKEVSSQASCQSHTASQWLACMETTFCKYGLVGQIGPMCSHHYKLGDFPLGSCLYE